MVTNTTATIGDVVMPDGWISTFAGNTINTYANVTTTATGDYHWATQQWDDTASWRVSWLDQSPGDLEVPKWENKRIQILNRKSQRHVEEMALKLLRSVLTEEEWTEWRQFHSVRILGSLGGFYEVGCPERPNGWGDRGKGWQGMLYKLGPGGVPEVKMCYHIPHYYPVGDKVAALILELRTNEGRILDKANKHKWRPHERERVTLRRAFRLAA